MRDKKVLITGSASGIGLAVAEKFAEKGAAVVLHGLADDGHWKTLENEFRAKYDCEAMIDKTDLSVEENIEKFCKRLKEDFGDFDMLVNNAGIQRINAVENFEDDVWKEVLFLNLTVPFMLCKRLIPDMRNKGWGRIINIASVHGLVASVNKPAYVASKHGLVGLTKCIALENAGLGITANAICPGWVETKLIQRQYEAIAEKERIPIEEAKKRLLFEKQPTGGFVKPEHIGELAVFLCTEAASQITGASYAIDGGWTAR